MNSLHPEHLILYTLQLIPALVIMTSHGPNQTHPVKSTQQNHTTHPQSHNPSPKHQNSRSPSNKKQEWMSDWFDIITITFNHPPLLSDKHRYISRSSKNASTPHHPTPKTPNVCIQQKNPRLYSAVITAAKSPHPSKRVRSVFLRKKSTKRKHAQFHYLARFFINRHELSLTFLRCRCGCCGPINC